MRFRIDLVVAAAIVAITSGCGTVEETGAPRALTDQEVLIVESSNEFGFDLFAEVVESGDEENVFVSPLSVSMALGMAHSGARAETEEGMREALRFGGLTNAEINESYRGLFDLLTTMDGKVTLDIANSVWYREGLDVVAEFMEACETYFYAVVEALDFDSSSAADTINSWVSDNTGGLIDEIVDGPIDPETMMLLVNAVYFKGDWTYRFEEEETRDASFEVDETTTVTVPMMHLHGEVSIYRGDTFKAVDLPYGDEYFSMAVLLPIGETTVDDVVDSLDSESWRAMLEGFGEEETTVEIPRFELEREYSLKQVLSVLGMEEAFEEGVADFTGISTSGDLFISEVKHKTFVRVDGVGTEAAAVTSVDIDAGCADDEAGFIADEPFVFAIHDRHAQSIIFIGKMVDPS